MFSKQTHIGVEGYTDVNCLGSIISGYFTFVGGNLVTWRRKKQKMVIRSSVEAEWKWLKEYANCYMVKEVIEGSWVGIEEGRELLF